jgi:hypothetical protein
LSLRDSAEWRGPARALHVAQATVTNSVTVSGRSVT